MPEKPNIILILADDMGYGDLSCYGAEKIHTPNIDRVTESGIKFTDAHSSSSVCTPSRYSIMTGRYCWKSILPQGVLSGFGSPIIEPERLTIASMLKSAGYATGVFGKWHLGLDWHLTDGRSVREATGGVQAPGYEGFDIDYSAALTGGPTDLGFDYWYGISGSLDMAPYCYIENDKTVGIPSKEKEIYYNQQRKGMQTDDFKDEEVDLTIAEKAVSFIENHISNNPEQPFFAYVPTAAPHRPCDIQPEIVKGKSKAGDRGDMVMLFDYVVGQLADTVEKLGINENTIIIVTSDNGARATCADGNDYGHKSNGELRGQKADIWDGGHREPLIIKWPGIIKAGSTSDKLICLMDFFATFADIINYDIAQDSGEDSISFLPILQDNKNTHLRENVIHHSGYGMYSIRKGDWKYIEALGSGGFTEPRDEKPLPNGPQGQLYNIKDDISETDNLWQQNPDVVNKLSKELQQIITE